MDKLKVAFVLFLMNDKEAEKWKTHFINRITGPDMKINFPKFSDFLKVVEFDFKPADVAGDAMNKLELLRQGGRPVEALITDFRNLCADAELEDKSVSDNQHLIKLFANCLNPQLKKKILFGEVVPKDIAGWIAKAIQYDSNYRMGQALMGLKEGGKKFPKKEWKETDPNAMDTSIRALMEEERTRLMKIGACFRCRKTGHLSWDCPDKNKGKLTSGGQQQGQPSAPKKFSPKEVHGNIRSLSKEERAELMALMTADNEDF